MIGKPVAWRAWAFLSLLPWLLAIRVPACGRETVRVIPAADPPPSSTHPSEAESGAAP